MMSLVICSLIVAGVAFGMLLYTRHQARELLSKLDSQLDKAISGEFVESHYDEKYQSAIEEKLNRFLSISQKQASDQRMTKEQVQSLVSNISHQTKTPLTNILLYSQLLGERSLNLADQSLVGEIEEQSNKLAFFIDTLVKTSYLESDLIQVRSKTNDVNLLIDQTIANVSQKAREKEILIDTKQHPTFARFDEKWTLEALTNVVENAIKYSPSKSKITIRVTDYEFFCCIKVEDEGPGVLENEKAQIFERFYRSQSVSHIEGLGIGLYLTRAILTEQGGYITVSSNEREGACFSLYLARDKI